jgi:phosphatidylglycerol---prolipoprotein diacylglyceryl transferase
MPLATIPMWNLPSLSLGPFTIQSFGILSAIGILVAVQLAAKGARELGRDPQVVLDFAVVGVLAGIVGGHLVHLFFYHPEELQEPWRILKVWEGLSSMGGLSGAILAAWIWFRRKGVSFDGYADAFALGLAPGWGIARVGCFTVHDHPGVKTDFFLAVRFADGPRHDLGLDEAIFLFALGALLWTLHRRGALRGKLLPLLALLYGIGRFLLDFLRARPGDPGIPYADARTGPLTYAQWFALLLVAYAIRGLLKKQKPAAPSAGRSTAPAGG